MAEKKPKRKRTQPTVKVYFPTKTEIRDSARDAQQIDESLSEFALKAIRNRRDALKQEATQ